MKIVRAVSEEKAMDYDTPLPHFNALEDALHSLFGENIKIVKKERIAGGDRPAVPALCMAASS